MFFLVLAADSHARGNCQKRGLRQYKERRKKENANQ
jgi:hypothetical protein